MSSAQPTFAVILKTGGRGQARAVHYPVISTVLDSGSLKSVINYGGTLVEAESQTGFQYITSPGQLTS